MVEFLLLSFDVVSESMIHIAYDFLILMSTWYILLKQILIRMCFVDGEPNKLFYR
jgi:hypothetical protein